LILIRESEKSLKEESERLLKEADEIAKIIGAGVLTMKGRR